MKTKLLLLVTLLLACYSNQLQAQTEYATGALPITDEELSRSPFLRLSPQSAATPLPSSVYNNEQIYFPPVYNQGYYIGCCVQAAEIGHTFTYEINRLRNVPAGSTWDTAYSNPQFHYNLYHPHFSYNFLNVNS